jgi:hypothetical protein
MTAPRNRLMAATIAIALLAALAWSYGRLSDSRAAAVAAAHDLADCRAMIAHIESLRRRPAVAGARELAAADLSRRIADAARTARIDERAIERIEPEPARRVGDTDYREVATQVRLRNLSLHQVFAFFHALGSTPATSATASLSLREVRLSAPRGDETSDRWTVESTVTYTVYAPRTETKTASIE